MTKLHGYNSIISICMWNKHYMQSIKEICPKKKVPKAGIDLIVQLVFVAVFPLRSASFTFLHTPIEMEYSLISSIP